MPQIPEPELIGDILSGSLIGQDDAVILLLGAAPVAAGEQVLRPAGPLVVRYAIPYLHQRTAIVPGLFASEYGEFLVGRQAWNYAQRNFTIHPRSDLVGLRPDGVQDQIMLRDLDFGRDVEVYAYESPDSREPVARLAAYRIGPGAPESLPDLLVKYLPRQ